MIFLVIVLVVFGLQRNNKNKTRNYMNLNNSLYALSVQPALYGLKATTVTIIKAATTKAIIKVICLPTYVERGNQVHLYFSILM